MDWIARHFPDPKSLAPEDVIIHKVRSILASDQKLGEIFGLDHIVASSVLAPPDLATLPELVITSMSGLETQRPGTLTNDIAIYLVVRFEWPQRGTLEPGEASLPTLLRYLNTSLLAGGNKRLTEDVGGQTIYLVTRSESGPVSYHLEPSSGDKNVFSLIKEWKYQVEVDPTSGRIRSLENAGG